VEYIQECISLLPAPVLILFFSPIKTKIMNSNAILSSDVLDIIFDDRNKLYGAYTLRKFYPNRVKTSLLIMLGLVVLLSAFTFLPEKKKIDGNPFTDTTLVLVKQIDIPADKPKTEPAPNKKAPQQIFTSTIETIKDIDSSTVLNDLDKLAIGDHSEITDFSAGPEEVFTGTFSGGGTAIPTPPAVPEVNNTTPVGNPDVPPTFPGGNKKLLEFLQNNLHAPEEIGETVQVQIKFVVGYDGNLQTFDVIKDGGEAFNNEVIRVLKKMPQWVPGKKGGRNVPAYIYLPVKFTPEE
jgi:protein TonB